MAEVRSLVRLGAVTVEHPSCAAPSSTASGSASANSRRSTSFCHLCRTNEIDLAQLPVRPITDQYLAPPRGLEFQDLEARGAYLVMAARTLIYLKSKLLCRPDDNAIDELLDDEALALKQELEDRLREYARVKALGGLLRQREAEQALLLGAPRRATALRGRHPASKDLSVHVLERALKHLIDEQVRRKPPDWNRTRVGARAHDGDPQPAARHVVVAVLHAGRRRTAPRRRRRDAVAVLELRPAGRISRAADRALRRLVLKPQTENEP